MRKDRSLLVFRWVVVCALGAAGCTGYLPISQVARLRRAQPVVAAERARARPSAWRQTRRNTIRDLLGIAGATITALTDSWSTIHARAEVNRDDIHALGWMQSEAYLALAKRSLRSKVLEPLRARGIDPVCTLPDGD